MEVKLSQSYLVHFIKKYKYLDFCLNELESLADMHGIKRDKLFVQPKETLTNIYKNPLVYVNLPSEEVANKIVKRSILIKEIIDVSSFISINITRFIHKGKHTMSFCKT